MTNKTVLALTVVLLLILTACSTQQENTIKIGVSTPHTGPAAATGQWIRNGIELALERLPADEQAKIELVYEDDQCTPTTGLSVARKLVEVDNIKFVIGPLCSEIILAVDDYYDENKVVRMQVGGAIEAFKTKGKYRFAFLGWIQDWMNALAEHLTKNGVKTVGIIYLEDAYGEENVKFFEKHFTSLGGKIVAKERFVRGDSDFRTQLLKIKEKKPDAVFLVAYGPTLANLFKQMNELQIDLTKISLYNTEDPEIVKSAGKLAEGVIYPSIIDSTKSEIKDWYAKKYQEKYGVPNEALSATAFDSFNILWDAIKNCGENSECVHTTIKNTKEFKGASGTFSVDQYGVGLRKPAVKVIKNGKFVFAKEGE